ncbi:FAD:protein FMN transferase [Pseudidiomarina salilacus]|uniref:FAD:protein FMN transferase n=1 Tax=Pseudidiomarina salilacus TaxID=3384452 RepID=UPI00398463AA
MLKVNTLTRFFVIAIALFASSCSQQATTETISGWAQGTTYHLTFWAEHQIDKKQIEAEITSELQRIDNSISNYLDSSVISRFNTNDSLESIEVNQEITELFSAAKAISIQSSGCYDPTILPCNPPPPPEKSKQL